MKTIMSSVDFKKVRKFGQKDKDIVYGFLKRMQSMFPTDNPYYIIVQLIQDLILLYFGIVIDTKVLKDEEQRELFEMVNSHTNNEYNGDWKLIFQATRDGFKRSDFYEKCDKLDNIICIIQTSQDTVLGGYTSLKLDQSKDCHEDDATAFVYLIRSNGKLDPKLYPALENGNLSVQHYFSGYLSFGYLGDAFFIHTEDSRNVCVAWISRDYCSQYGLERYQLHGENYRVGLTEIEVFQLQKL